MSEASGSRATILEQITPFFHVADLDAAVQFFVTGLGFKAHVHAPDYAYVHRDGAGVRLLLRGDAAEYLTADPPSVDRRYAYLDVQGVDSLHTELRSRLTHELSNNPDGPRDQTYGQREFTVFGPERIVLFFGEAITASRQGE